MRSAALLGAASLFASFATTLAADEVVQSFDGEGDRSTRPFHVDGAWELQWSVAGTASFYVRPATGGVYVMNATSKGGAGASYCPEVGDFYVQVISTGTWTIKVVRIR